MVAAENPVDDFNFDSRMRSSEEPGQARRGSRPPSALGSHFDFDLRPTQDVSASQRSTFFPWDHAGPSSSVAGAPFDFDGSDVFSALRPVSKRGNSVGSRRESLMLPGGGTVPPSPADLGPRNSLVGGEDFQFNGQCRFNVLRRCPMLTEICSARRSGHGRVAAVERPDPRAQLVQLPRVRVPYIMEHSCLI